MWTLVFLSAFAFAWLASLCLVPLFRRLAVSRGLLDRPGERKIHHHPTPLLGGAGIVAAVCLTVLLGFPAALLLRPFWPAALAEHLPGALSVLPRLLLVLGGGVLVFLFGLVDDRRGLKAGWKLAGQALIALLLFASGLRITIFIPVPAISLLLTVGWILFITNSFNLLDNMNGLAAGTAFIASLLFFLYALGSGALFVALLLAALAGACLGFLRYNFPRASIFLGESGSTFLGYFLAVSAVVATFYHQEAPTHLPVLAPLFILALPIYDTLSVMLLRRRAGRSVFTPGRDHFSHRLVAAGLTRTRAVLTMYLLSLGMGLPALVLGELPLYGGSLLLLQGLLFLGVVSLLGTGRPPAPEAGQGEDQ